MKKRFSYLYLAIMVIGVLAMPKEVAKRGRIVDRPDGPADLSGPQWRRAFKETKRALKNKELGANAAGLAYYATLTFFPTVLGIATCVSYFAEPGWLLQQLDKLTIIMPSELAKIVRQQLRPLASIGKQALGITAMVSVLALLWTTSGGMQNLVKCINRAYDVPETRNFVKLRLVSAVLSGGLLIIGAVMAALLLAQGDVLRMLDAPQWLASAFPAIRWGLIAGLVSVSLAFIYRYAPARSQPRWQWVSWGATAAALLWLLGSALFFLYAHNLANFNKTYGAFASIIVLMIWFNLSSFIILLGAQVNHSLERRVG